MLTRLLDPRLIPRRSAICRAISPPRGGSQDRRCGELRVPACSTIGTMSTKSTGSPGITGTDFLAVPTRDMARAVEFYENVLELRCSVRPSSAQRAPYAEFETGNLTLGFFEPEHMGREFQANPNPVAL